MIADLEIVTERTVGGNTATFCTRPGTNDGPVVAAILGQNDEYHLRGETLTGWAIDVGAHIGAWCIAAALDNPGLRVLAIEAVPDNAELLRRNVALNGLTGRIEVIEGAASHTDVGTVPVWWGYTHKEGEGDAYVAMHRYIGGTWGAGASPEFTKPMPAVSLEGLLEHYGVDRVSIVKCDCEGCEYAFFDSPAIGRVDRIVGEVHFGTDQLHTILDDTHVLDFPGYAGNPDFGPFTAVRR